uniref:VPS37 C-terminal domain-containing protein n=1 Tax=Ursus maritimus TaxID=29073 RepID=A0A452TCI1_URSMA
MAKIAWVGGSKYQGKTGVRLRESYEKTTQNVQLSKEMTLASNRSLAEGNLLYQPQLDSLKARLTQKYQELQVLFEAYQIKKTKLDKQSSSASLETLLALLQAEGAKIEEDTENMAEKFLDGELPLDSFIDVYQSQRKLAHTRRVKIEKLQELVLKGQRLPQASAPAPLLPRQLSGPLPCVARPEEMNSPGAAPRRRAVATVQVCFIANLTLQQGSTTGKAEGLVPVLFSRPWLVPGRRGAATFKGPKLLVFCSQPLPRVGVGAQGTRILANALPSGAGRPRVELGCHRAARWAPFLGGTRRPRPGEWQAGVLVPGPLVAKLGRPSGRWAGPSEGRVEAGRGWTMGNTQNGPSRAEAASRGTKTRKQGHHSWEKRLQE